jgi:2-polyprenyl-6-methoxyphenol hydroxylase-like FAD-dependent oxidoreductase
MTDFIAEPARQTPVVFEADLCVVGGSCTGVFAAVRAARLGLKVAIVEQNSIFGGMATAAQVNDWHSTLDAHYAKPVIGGLTIELIDRLRTRGAVHEVPPGGRSQFRFNSAEMAVELDDFVTSHGIRPFLCARVVAAQREGNRVGAAIIEDKSGRRAIAARAFIDASGDGDLIRRAGFAAYQPEKLQPVNMQALIYGLDNLKTDAVRSGIRNRADEYGYPRDNSSPWFMVWPGVPAIYNIFGPRLNGVDASDADDLTATLMEGRRLHRALLDMVRDESGDQLNVVAWAHALGVRETWHAHCLHRLTAVELLQGYPFEDAIANGTYPVDVHSPEGTFLRYLDGREEIVRRDGTQHWGRWRPENTPTPRCYHVPYRSLVPRDAENVLVAGRVLDADREAFGGVRVMVNMNQTGEAAGVAAALAVKHGWDVAGVDVQALRRELANGGSIFI